MVFTISFVVLKVKFCVNINGEEILAYNTFVCGHNFLYLTGRSHTFGDLSQCSEVSRTDSSIRSRPPSEWKAMSFLGEKLMRTAVEDLGLRKGFSCKGKK